MTIRFTPEAAIELEDVLRYLAAHLPEGARNVGARIQQVLSNLSEYPLTGMRTSLEPMRRVAVTPYPYLIFYLPGDDEIIVVGIRHAARDPSSMPDQL
nr:type II toxin-antitoxin system RelE/ParE family toxin [Neorhizobium tomejilense]